jgi:HAMP domain-containing protein
MFTNLQLSTKFTLLLAIVFVVGVIIGGFVLWQVLQRNAQAEITARGVILIETMNGVRSYTSNHVGPRLADDLASQAEFIPETVPAFSAREVFENFRQKEAYKTFLYKEASLNPTNPRDQADPFEADLVKRMRQDAQLQELSGFRNLFGQDVFYIARPLAIKSESCLGCHSSPETAPANLLATYGSENGFGWKLNDIVAAQMIYVPAQEVFRTALHSFSIVMAIFVATFATIILLINFLLKRYVIDPVEVVGRLAQNVSEDQLKAEDIEAPALTRITTRADELGHLALVFQQMAREVYARTQRLKEQVQNLRIEIDEIRRQQDVAKIVESDFFQDLQAKADKVRQQRRRNKPDEDIIGSED